MKIELEINDRQAEFLRQFAKNQHEGARDNIGTRKPLHLVQTEELEYIYDGGGNGDYDVFICTDDYSETYPTEKELVLALGYYNDKSDVVDYETAWSNNLTDPVTEEEVLICDFEDYLTFYGLDPENILRCSVIVRYRTVAYFWILENARQYIKYQGHNLTNPRTYTVGGGYSNKGEYESFFDLLMAAGTALLGGGKE